VFNNPFDQESGVQLNVLGQYHDSVEVPIQVEGTILSFTCRTPTFEELDVLPHLPLTLTAEWNPHTVRLSSLCVAEEVTPSSVEFNDAVEDVSCLCSKTDLSTCLLSQVIVHSHPKDVPDTWGFQAYDRHLAKTADELSNLWGIGLETAKKTLRVTTRRGVRSAVLPLSRRYQTDLFYQKPRLHGRFYSDTILVGTRA
jgi:hypothetical protein